MITTTDQMPGWPPKGVIGPERARQYIAWMKRHAYALIEAGKAEMKSEYRYAEITTQSLSVAQMATTAPDKDGRLRVGQIRGALVPRGSAEISVWITGGGRIELVAGAGMRGEHPHKY